MARNGVRYTDVDIARAKQMYKQGELPADIARALGVAKSTVLRWLQDVQLPSALAQTMTAKRRKRKADVLVRVRPEGDKRRWENMHAEGASSRPSLLDALCIGLYMAEGSKKPRTPTSSAKWKVANADTAIIELMIQWAIRAGQPTGAFRAQIQIHSDQPATDDQVKQYWAMAGVPAEKIAIYRLPPKDGDDKPHHELPYGTCYLVSIGNGVRLYQYLLGQREAVLKSGPAELPMITPQPLVMQALKKEAVIPVPSQPGNVAAVSPLPMQSCTGDIQDQVLVLYKAGLFKPDISTRLGIPYGTIATWIAKAHFTDEEKAAIEQKQAAKRAIQRRNGHLIFLQECDQDRRAAYRLGIESDLTLQDAYFVGLYWGDGAKHLCGDGRSPEWKMTNSDRDIIQASVDWAVRQGQAPGQFTARVLVYKGLPATEDEIKAHWARAGVPLANISLHYSKDSPKNAGKPHKTPWGTCQVMPCGNRTRLFWIWRGQLDHLTGDVNLQRESLALLDILAQRGVSDTSPVTDEIAPPVQIDTEQIG